MPLIYNNLDSALEFWDEVDEYSKVYLLILIGNKEKKRPNTLFLEDAWNNRKERKIIRIFLTKDEIYKYKKIIKKENMSTAKTTIEYLLNFLNEKENIGEVDEPVDCMLSTIDVDGNIHSVEMLWSSSTVLN